MATRFQLKRSTVGGVVPTAIDVATAELAINLVDRKLFSSNGTSIFEIGSNLTSLSVGNTTTVQTLNSTGIYSTGVVNTVSLTIGTSTIANATGVYTTGTVNGATISVGTSFTANTTRLVLDTTVGLQANGGIGTAGQVLTSNATTVYWSTPTTGTVTSISTGNGLSGGPITSTGTVSVLANSGITANSTGTFVTQGTGMVVNATGIHVNATYIGTLSANNTTYLNGQLAAYYTNASNITTGTLPWAQAPTGTVNTSAAFTFSALHTFNGNTSALSAVFVNAGETSTISATAANGTINYDLTTQSVLYYTTNAAANWTVNFRGSSGTSLNNALANSQTITAAFLVTQGATAYFANNTQVDGANVTPKWQGGTAPTAGNASGIDVYVYTIIKTANATFTVLASQTKYA
jgi:hypothetical protein